MRKATLAGLILLISITSWSQEKEYKTIVDFNDTRISGMGGLMMQFTAIDGEFAHMLGGGGAILLGDFFFGAYGLGLTNMIPANRPQITDYQAGDRLYCGPWWFLAGIFPVWRPGHSRNIFLPCGLGYAGCPKGLLPGNPVSGWYFCNKPNHRG